MDIPQLYLDSNESIKSIIINLGTTALINYFCKSNDDIIAT